MFRRALPQEHHQEGPGAGGPADRLAGTLALSAYCAMKNTAARGFDVGKTEAVAMIEALGRKGSDARGDLP